MLDPVHLRTLSAVVRHRSFAAAAAELRYTPSAVSQQMSALERSCGVALFERLPHGIVATGAAELLSGRSADLLADLAAAERAVTEVARGHSGVLRVGAFPTAGARLVPAALRAFVRERPGIGVQLDEGEPGALTASLLGGTLDVALVYRYDLVPVDDDARLSGVELLREQVRLLVHRDHPLARASAARSRPVPISTVRDERWVAPLSGSPGALSLDRRCATAGFTPAVAFRSNDYSVVRGLVAAGLGVALVPDLALVDDERVRAVTLSGRRQAAGRTVRLLYRTSNRNPLLPPMIAALQTAASDVLAA